MFQKWMIFAFLGLIARYGVAQDSQNLLQGYNPNDSYGEYGFDSVDYTTGNLMVHIPLVSYPQTGTLPPFDLLLRYNAANWVDTSLPCTPTAVQSCPVYGWVYWGSGVQVVRGNTLGEVNCRYVRQDPPSDPITYVYHHIRDSSGADHPLAKVSANIEESIDGSGLQLASGDRKSVV